MSGAVLSPRRMHEVFGYRMLVPSRADRLVATANLGGRIHGQASIGYRSVCGVNPAVESATAKHTPFADCIFSDWSGFHSPLTIKYQSVANVRNTVFRNMALAVEIADVSYEGMVRFANVSFANVTLAHGAVVSTTLNDYQEAIGFYLTYYAEDDVAYDVPLEPVPAGEGGVFGAEFRIKEETLSDCIYLLASAGTVLPGCPTVTLAARNRTIDRGFDSGGDRLSTGVPFSQEPGQDEYAGVPLSSVPLAAEDEFIQSRYDDYGGAVSYHDYLGISADGLTDYEIINKPDVRFDEVMLRADNDWLAATRQVCIVMRAACIVMRAACCVMRAACCLQAPWVAGGATSKCETCLCVVLHNLRNKTIPDQRIC